MTAYTLLLGMGRAAVVVWGWLVLVVLIGLVVRETYIFVDPRFEGFWEDVRAYQFDEEGSKSEEELGVRYGPRAMVTYVLDPGLTAVYMPSEEAAFTSIVAYIRRLHKDEASGTSRSVPIPVVGVGMLVVLYVPTVISARVAQRLLSALMCRRARAREARAAYFRTVDEAGLRSAFEGFAVTIALCVVSAYWHWSPSLQAIGLDLVELTGALVILAHFGGLWLKMVSHLVDMCFLMFGANPHLSLWDDVIALAILTPVLSLVYVNSWLTILTTASAGLASGFFLKWRQHHRQHNRLR